MKREWDIPAIQNVTLNETALSTQPDEESDGAYLGWLGRDGTNCTVCS